MNIHLKKILSLFVLVGFISIVNVDGFSRGAKYSYLTTSGIKLPAILASSYYDYKFSEDNSDAVKLKKLEYRVLDALLELSNEIAFYKLGSSSNSVLLFDFVRLIKYSAKFLKFKQQSNDGVVEKNDDLKNLNKDLEMDGIAVDSVDLNAVADELGLSEEEVCLLLNNSEDDKQSEKDEDEIVGGKSLKSKIKLILCSILGIIESGAPLSVYGVGGDYLAKYKARQLAYTAKLLRYAISSESLLGKSGAICILLMTLVVTSLRLYIVENNTAQEFNISGMGNEGLTRLAINFGDIDKNKLRRMDGFSDLFISPNDDEKGVGRCDDERCNICLEDYKKDEKIYLPKCCNHTFHRHCVEKSFETDASGRLDTSNEQGGVQLAQINNSPRCPMCRRENPIFNGPYKFKK